jgi:hypothetical protein
VRVQTGYAECNVPVPEPWTEPICRFPALQGLEGLRRFVAQWRGSWVERSETEQSGSQESTTGGGSQPMRSLPRDSLTISAKYCHSFSVGHRFSSRQGIRARQLASGEGVRCGPTEMRGMMGPLWEIVGGKSAWILAFDVVFEILVFHVHLGELCLDYVTD